MRKARCTTPTEFGKEMRKLRIDRGETMKDTCKALGVTQAYISHMENGKCQVPDGFEEKVISLYDLSDDNANRLREAAILSKNRYVISAKTNLQKKMAYLLSKHVDTLTEDEINGITEFIEESLSLSKEDKEELTEIESGDKN